MRRNYWNNRYSSTSACKTESRLRMATNYIHIITIILDVARLSLEESPTKVSCWMSVQNGVCVVVVEVQWTLACVYSGQAELKDTVKTTLRELHSRHTPSPQLKLTSRVTSPCLCPPHLSYHFTFPQFSPCQKRWQFLHCRLWGKSLAWQLWLLSQAA